MFVQDGPLRIGSAKRKGTAPVKKQTRVLRKIRKYQKSTDLLISKASFARLVKEVAMKIYLYNDELRWQLSAIRCLQEASKAYFVSIFEECDLLVHNAKRVTIMPKDLHLVLELSKSYRGGL